MQGTGLGAVGSEEQQALPQRNISSEEMDPIPIGRAEPMSHHLIWPRYSGMMTSSLFTMDLEPTPPRSDSKERWRLLHPYELEGVFNPTANTPDNLQRLARSEESVETIQTMEHLTYHPPPPPMGARRDFRLYPPCYGDLYYHRPRPRQGDDQRRTPPTRGNGDYLDRRNFPMGANNITLGGPRGNMTPLRWIQNTELNMGDTEFPPPLPKDAHILHPHPSHLTSLRG